MSKSWKLGPLYIIYGKHWPMRWIPVVEVSKRRVVVLWLHGVVSHPSLHDCYKQTMEH